MLEVTKKDIPILRSLAEKYMHIVHRNSYEETKRLWRLMNDNQGLRPMIWIDEVPWHEMDVDNELTLSCEGSLAQQWETYLRRSLYTEKHMKTDTVFSPYLSIRKTYSGGRFDVQAEENIQYTDPQNRIVSHAYKGQITTCADVDRLVHLPDAHYEKKQSEHIYALAHEIFSPILPVYLVGTPHIWFTPWDNLIRLWGVEEALVDLYLKPELVSYAVERYVLEAMRVLSSFESEQLFSCGAQNIRVGSGGYGYLAGFPEEEYSSCSPEHMWGCSNAQIFSDVSPQMHWDFALQYDIPWLSRWGANYYGCCEPLHHKSEIISRIPHLKKISMSPWANLVKAQQAYEKKFVFSIKPNPAIFVSNDWNCDRIQKELRILLQPIVEAGISCEVIMKDISTVQYHPKRLWEWSQIAVQVAQELAAYY